MKKLITFLFVLSAIPVFPQWTLLNTVPASQMNDVYCVTENSVYVGCNNGKILKTSDGGVTWINSTTGTTHNLIKINFPSANVGYAIGRKTEENDVLLKTIDAGVSWTILSIDNVTFISDISCINEDSLYISTSENLIKTIDGGNSFQIIGGVQCGGKIQFINNMVGFISCWGELLKTVDGGSNWSSIGCVDTTLNETAGVFNFFNEFIGYKKCSNIIYKTNDGGINYNYLTSINWYMGEIYAVNENIFWGITVDYLLNGQPNYTMRGEIDSFGEFQSLLNDYPTFISIYFANPTNGYAIGDGGLYKNTTGTMLGLNEVSKKQNLTIYPNPATNQITVSLTELPTQFFEIEITNMLGKKVYAQYYQPINNVSIDTKAFSKGVYFLTVIQQDKKETQKIIID